MRVYCLSLFLLVSLLQMFGLRLLGRRPICRRPFCLRRFAFKQTVKIHPKKLSTVAPTTSMEATALQAKKAKLERGRQNDLLATAAIAILERKRQAQTEKDIQDTIPTSAMALAEYSAWEAEKAEEAKKCRDAIQKLGKLPSKRQVLERFHADKKEKVRLNALAIQQAETKEQELRSQARQTNL